MAINPLTRYPSQIDGTDPTGYPYGKAKNITTAGDGTGTPWEKDLANDFLGFGQALLSAAGVAPSGTPEKVGASQFCDGVTALARTEGRPRDSLLALTQWSTLLASEQENWAGYDSVKKTWIFGFSDNAYAKWTYGGGTGDYFSSTIPAHTWGNGSTIDGVAGNGLIIVPNLSGVSSTGARYSVDGGLTFQNDAGDSGRLTNRRLLFDGINILGSGTANTIRTTNGTTWNTNTAARPISPNSEFSHNGAGTVLIVNGTRASSSGVGSWAMTTNQGSSWTTADLGGANNLLCSAYHNGYWFVAGNDGSDLPLLRRSADGVTWSTVAADLSWIPGTTGYFFSMASLGSALVAVFYSINGIGSSFLMASVDLGATWQPIRNLIGAQPPKIRSNGRQALMFRSGNSAGPIMLSASI